MKRLSVSVVYTVFRGPGYCSYYEPRIAGEKLCVDATPTPTVIVGRRFFSSSVDRTYGRQTIPFSVVFRRPTKKDDNDPVGLSAFSSFFLLLLGQSREATSNTTIQHSEKARKQAYGMPSLSKSQQQQASAGKLVSAVGGGPKKGSSILQQRQRPTSSSSSAAAGTPPSTSMTAILSGPGTAAPRPATAAVEPPRPLPSSSSSKPTAPPPPPSSSAASGPAPPQPSFSVPPPPTHPQAPLPPVLATAASMVSEEAQQQQRELLLLLERRRQQQQQQQQAVHPQVVAAIKEAQRRFAESLDDEARAQVQEGRTLSDDPVLAKRMREFQAEEMGRVDPDVLAAHERQMRQLHAQRQMAAAMRHRQQQQARETMLRQRDQAKATVMSNPAFAERMKQAEQAFLQQMDPEKRTEMLRTGKMDDETARQLRTFQAAVMQTFDPTLPDLQSLQVGLSKQRQETMQTQQQRQQGEGRTGGTTAASVGGTGPFSAGRAAPPPSQLPSQSQRQMGMTPPVPPQDGGGIGGLAAKLNMDPATVDKIRADPVGRQYFPFFPSKKGGTPYSEKNYSGVRKVVVRAGRFVDSIQLFYRDGTQSKAFGGTGGKAFEFVVGDKDDDDDAIVHATVWSGWGTDAVQFKTRKGKTSPRFGGPGGTQRVCQVRTDGDVDGFLIGVKGRCNVMVDYVDFVFSGS